MTHSPEPSTVISQVLTFSAKLTEALASADDLGGLARLRGKVRPATATKLAEGLRMLRAEIDEQLEALDAPAPPKRSVLLRRQANRPAPDLGRRAGA